MKNHRRTIRKWERIACDLLSRANRLYEQSEAKHREYVFAMRKLRELEAMR